MDFMEKQKRFDFLYDGVPFGQLSCTALQQQDGASLITVYTLPDGLRIMNIAQKHGEAWEWVNWFENTSDTPSGILSELWDCDVELPVPYEPVQPFTSLQPLFHEITAVHVPGGADHAEFADFADRKKGNSYVGQLYTGKSREYSASGGCSSEKDAPFFNIHKAGRGYIIAIGWTGQWNCRISRSEESVRFQSKLEDTYFRLLPGEKLRTSSVVIMPYEGTAIQGQNKWRRLVREHYALIGKTGRDAQGPLCASIWGGLHTKTVLERIALIRKYSLPFDYIWMDAGWFGANTQPSADEFEGDWGRQVGDWQVSPHVHPGGLTDVAKAVHEAGMKFLLWFEPERMRFNMPMVQQHPEYFLRPEEGRNYLLDLGNPEAWQWAFDTIAGLIEKIGIDCYRQDFNFWTLDIWRRYDAPDRQGITEIKYICGMYRLWDALLERFPHLLIDNCAGGGRRIDIETLRRSIPLWRSDYECSANYLVEGVQCHHLSFNRWLPFSGTSCGRDYDAYRIRSAYGPALVTGHAYNERVVFDDDPEKMAWLKRYLAEYLQVRPYMEGDFYPLTSVSDRRDVWSAAQFHRPGEKDGILQIFRREEAPYTCARFPLFGLDGDGQYRFTDADDGSTVTLPGNQLLIEGFPAELTERPAAKLWFYKKI